MVITFLEGEFIRIPFYYFKRPTWDKFKGADETFTPDTLMPDGKRNQLASTHDLGHNFAKAYDIIYKKINSVKHDENSFYAGFLRLP